MQTRFLHILSAVVLTAGIVLVNLPSAAFAGKPTKGGGNSDTISAWAEFTDPLGTLVGDNGGAYVDGIDDVLVELADNTGFRLVPQKKSPRTLAINFGPLVSCSSSGPLDCISDVSENIIECPIPAGDRPVSGAYVGDCQGNEKIWVRLKNVFVNSDTATNILYMQPDDKQYLGQYFDAEIYIYIPNGSSWELVFKKNPGISDCAGAENLGVVASDSSGGGVTDTWQISTDTTDVSYPTDQRKSPDKIACLVKETRHGTSLAMGFVDMTFTLTIHRL